MPPRLVSLNRVPLGRGKPPPAAVNGRQYVPAGQGGAPMAVSQRPPTSVSTRRQLPSPGVDGFGRQDQFSGHITPRPAGNGHIEEKSVLSQTSSTQRAPLVTPRDGGWGRQKFRQAGRVPKAELLVAGVASAKQLVPIGPGLVQLADCERARRDWLQRAPSKMGVAARRSRATSPPFAD
jgi:hypothetical protein